MHDMEYVHQHELDKHDFLGCCKNCRDSLNIIKPHIMDFAEKIKKYDMEMLAALPPDDLYRLYQLLDDLAHMEAGENLARLILAEPDIRRELPVIRAYYSSFFNIHENHLADTLCGAKTPWETLESFPLYPRYVSLVKTQIETLSPAPESIMAFVGSGPVPMTLILLSRLYGMRSVGIDMSSESVEQAQRVVQHLGLEDAIRILNGDESSLEEFSWDMVLVAALSEPKQRIFNTLKELLKKKPAHTPVIYRTYTGMRAVLYEPVKDEDVAGLTTIKKIYPSGRVNNTLVFAELSQ